MRVKILCLQTNSACRPLIVIEEYEVEYLDVTISPDNLGSQCVCLCVCMCCVCVCVCVCVNA